MLKDLCAAIRRLVYILLVRVCLLNTLKLCPKIFFSNHGLIDTEF